MHLPVEDGVEKTPIRTTATPEPTAPVSTAVTTGAVTETVSDGGGDGLILDGLFRLFGLERGLSDLPIIGWLFDGASPEQGDQKVGPEPTGASSGEDPVTPAVSVGENPASATISVVTHPAGAMITLDGTYLGVITPADLKDVPTGRHTLRFDLAHYSSYETSFDLDGDTAIAVALSPQNPNVNENPLCLNLATMQGWRSVRRILWRRPTMAPTFTSTAKKSTERLPSSTA
jgi:hypothetical protein